MTGGIPVIATADTWTSELVERLGAGIAVSDGDASAFATAMAAFARDRVQLAGKALGRREAALAELSGVAFLELLWG